MQIVSPFPEASLSSVTSGFRRKSFDSHRQYKVLSDSLLISYADCCLFWEFYPKTNNRFAFFHTLSLFDICFGVVVWSEPKFSSAKVESSKSDYISLAVIIKRHPIAGICCSSSSLCFSSLKEMPSLIRGNILSFSRCISRRSFARMQQCLALTITNVETSFWWKNPFYFHTKTASICM